MYVGTHSNPYIASLSMQRGQQVSILGKTASGLNIYASAPIKNNVAGNESATYLSELKTGASELKSALQKLTGGSAFKQKIATSSNPDLMTVASGKATGNGKSVEVKIDQLATTQKNVGEALNSSAQIGQDGYYQFQIEIDGKAHQLSFSASAQDTNKTFQEKMAKAINDADLGVKASLTTDKQTTSLVLESAETGDLSKNVFKVSDLAGDAVAKTGVNVNVQEAKDAIYTVDGEILTSNSNTVTLSNGLSATFKSASDQTVTASSSVNPKSAISEIQNLVNSYNKLYDAAFNNITDNKANNLLLDLNNIATTYLDSLNRIGIGFDSTGKMTIDSETMERAAEDGSLERFFTENANTNYGFTNQLNKVASTIDTNITRYAGVDTFIQASTSSSSSSNALDAATFKSAFASAGLNNSWNLRNFNVGILFDALF